MANKHDDDHDDEQTYSRRRGADDESSSGPSMGDAIRKLFTAGVSAAFMTEEALRSIVGDMKLPKETLNMLLQGATKSKEEMMNRVSREVIGIINKIDFVKEASRFVEEHKFKISAEIEVLKREPSPNETNPDAKAVTLTSDSSLKVKTQKKS